MWGHFQQYADPVTYYYVLNLQGDVVGLLDETGQEIAVYTYNAWGEILSITDPDGNATTSSTHIANLNPLCYRGYDYDSETGFYYLQSRYYDPVTHRFINADIFATTDASDAISCNMFAYCGNNPVTRFDNDGEFWNIVIGAVVGAVVGAVTTALTGGDAGAGDVIISALCGAASGALSAAFPGAGLVIDAAFTAVEEVAIGLKNGDSAAEIVSDTVISVGFSVILSGRSSVLSDSKTFEVLDAGLNKIKNAYRPAVEAQARKAFTKDLKKTIKTVGREVAEWTAIQAMKYGTSEYMKGYLEYIGLK